MVKSPRTHQRTNVPAGMACAACRHLKMRCIGAQDPPCARCAKSGRFCIIPQSSQKQLQRQQQHSANIRHMQYASGCSVLSTVQAPNSDPCRPPISWSMTNPSLQSTPAQASSLSALSSPLNLSGTPAPSHSATSPAHVQGRSDLGSGLMSNIRRHNSASDSAPSLPSDEELCHLSRFFITNLLPQIPVLTEFDVADLKATVKSKRPLVYSMAYTAARFVPGCKAIRTKLSPTIVALAKLQFDRIGIVDSNDECQWTLLQALAILYNWAPRQHSDLGAYHSDIPTELWQEALRGPIETFAFRHSLHKSAEEVVDLLDRGAEDIQRTFAFRKYFYWLWLFGVVHFRSLVSQTPPSIREDATIRNAAQLLEGMNGDIRVRYVLARVELCLLWMQGGLRERGLGEWWCNFHTRVNFDSTLTLLNELDIATQKWRQKWCFPEKNTPFDDVTKSGKDGAIDFYYHFTCFSMGAYVARALQSLTLEGALTVPKINLLMKTIERAYTICQFFLELSPLAKSSVCFGPEISFAMVEMSCEYLLQIHNSSKELALIQPAHLDAICGVAELMVDMGVDEKHGASLYGQHILARMRMYTAKLPEELQKPQMRNNHHKRSLTWAAGGNEQQAQQTLFSLATNTDDTLRGQENLGQRGLSNEHQQSLTTGSNDVAGIWATYQGGTALGSGDLYWTS